MPSMAMMLPGQNHLNDSDPSAAFGHNSGADQKRKAASVTQSKSTNYFTLLKKKLHRVLEHGL